MTNFCGTCGTKFVPGSKFCGICGAGVVSQSTPPSPSPATVEFVPPPTSPSGAGIGKLAIVGAALFVAVVVVGVVRQASSAVAATEKDGTVTRTAAKNVSTSPVIDVVRNGTMTGYETTTIGRAFEATFRNPQWTFIETAKGEKVVAFTGIVPYDDDAFDNALVAYSKCATKVEEVKAMPNYSFIKYSVSGYGYQGPGALKMAEANKGNEARIAELFNSYSYGVAGDHQLDGFGNIGPGNAVFDKFIKENNDISICGPGTKEKLATATFQWTFNTDGKSFKLSYIDEKPWWHAKGDFRVQSVNEYRPGHYEPMTIISTEKILSFIYH